MTVVGARRTYYHDLLVAVYSSHNVFSQGRGTDICMDHHGAAPNSNLWTDIDVVSCMGCRLAGGSRLQLEIHVFGTTCQVDDGVQGLQLMVLSY